MTVLRIPQFMMQEWASSWSLSARKPAISVVKSTRPTFVSATISCNAFAVKSNQKRGKKQSSAAKTVCPHVASFHRATTLCDMRRAHTYLPTSHVVLGHATVTAVLLHGQDLLQLGAIHDHASLGRHVPVFVRADPEKGQAGLERFRDPKRDQHQSLCKLDRSSLGSARTSAICCETHSFLFVVDQKQQLLQEYGNYKSSLATKRSGGAHKPNLSGLAALTEPEKWAPPQ